MTPVHYLTPPANNTYNKLLLVSYTTHKRMTLPFSWHYQQSPYNKVPLLKKHLLMSTNSLTTCGHTLMQKLDTELPIWSSMYTLMRYVQQILRFYYQPGQESLGDYPSKHHSGEIHQHVRPYYVHMNNSPTVLPRAAKPSTQRGCAETLADPYKGKIPLHRVNSFQEPFTSRQIIQQKSPNSWRGKSNQYLEPSPETHRIHSFPIDTE